MIFSAMPPKSWLGNMPCTLDANYFCSQGFMAQQGVQQAAALIPARGQTPLPCSPALQAPLFTQDLQDKSRQPVRDPGTALPVPARAGEYQHILARGAMHCTKNRAPPLYCYASMFRE